jgi:endonuclease YncB( thermonuclease family)
MIRRLLLTLCALAPAALALPAGASALNNGPPPKYRAACNPGGPTCMFWTAKVTAVNDGDTIDVIFDNDPSRHVFQIRHIGVQAMEETVYSNNPAKRRGQCHAVQAANVIQSLVERGHWRVRLSAQTYRTDRIDRLFRSPAVKINGHWIDMGKVETTKGVVLWMNVNGETAWNQIYNTLDQRAQLKHIGMWDPTACGSGPDQSVPLKTWVMSDPLGDDPADLNGEYIKVLNQSATQSVSLANWWVRDSGLRRYTFPAGTVLRPGHTITVHVGSGQDTAETFYWGLPATIFENTATGGGQGDGAYLFDPKGDLRSYLVYPCLVSCSDPNQGAVQITAHPFGVEYALIKDVSNHPVDLYGYELRTPGGYGFDEDSTLQPGETMQVDVKGDPSSDTRLHKHMGIDGAYLPDSGGALKVTTFDEIPLSCDSWGSGHC